MGQDEKGEVIFNGTQKTLLVVTFMPMERITWVIAVVPPFIQNWARKQKDIYIFSMYACTQPQTRLFLLMWSHLHVPLQTGKKFQHQNLRKPPTKQGSAHSSSDLF